MNASIAHVTAQAATLDTDRGGAPASAAPDGAPSKRALWGGRVLGGLVALFFAFDASMKVLDVPQAVEGTTKLGYPASVLQPLGVVQIVCLILYVVPRTSVLGAILWTGYLGGAVATHVRVGDPLFSHVLFPIYLAIVMWGSSWLRSPSLRKVVPVRSTTW